MLIKTVVGGYTQKDAEKILLNCDSGINILKMEAVFYPYKNISYDLEVGKKRLGKLNKTADCIIDLILGRPAVGEGKPIYEVIEIDESCTLKPKLCEKEVYEIGHNFVFKLYLNKAKLLHTPNIKITDETFFYKKFYIVHCKDVEEQDYFIMVDSMDGGISILDHKE